MCIDRLNFSLILPGIVGFTPPKGFLGEVKELCLPGGDELEDFAGDFSPSLWLVSLKLEFSSSFAVKALTPLAVSSSSRLFFSSSSSRISIGLIILRRWSTSFDPDSSFFCFSEFKSSFSGGSFSSSFSSTIFLSLGRGSSPQDSLDDKLCFNGGGGGLLTLPTLESTAREGFNRGNVRGTFGGKLFRNKPP